MTHDPFRDMIDQMNAMLRDFDKQDLSTGTTMPVDFRETEDAVIIEADMPGLEKDNIHVQIKDNTVHISAEDREELHEKGKDYIRKERSARSYSRTVPLNTPVEKSTASAEYSDGVLRIEVEKVEQNGGTEIDIE